MNSTESMSPEVRKGQHVARPALFVVLQANELREEALRIRLDGVSSVRIGRGEQRSAREEKGAIELSLADSRVSREHCEIVAVDGGFSIVDKDSKNGSLVGSRTIREAVELRDGDWIEVGRTFLRFRARCEMPPGTDRVERPGGAGGLRTLWPTLASELQKLEEIAPSKVPVLILGETGTGKERAAAAVHELSKRKGPFQAVNCGALPPSLVASELFGNVKGAFSGADKDRPGLVRSAEGGTLFLDEVGDLSPEAQVALLRVLQEHEVLPVGGTRALPVDVRVVAATHRDLQRSVERGQFRADLLARLRGFTLSLPPLEERLEDLGVLVAAIIARRLPDGELSLENAAARALLQHGYPHNVRELEQALLAAAPLARDRPVAVADLPEALRAPAPLPEENLKDQLVAAMTKHEGNISAVATELGKARVQIRRWLARFGLDAKSFRKS